jgi:hypothetical protein
VAENGTRQEPQRKGHGFLFPFALCLFPFLLLSTLNSAGYRYGASDLAFYIPAALERLHPGLFPRDGALIASQARLTLIDEVIAGLARTTGLALPALFATLYCVTLSLLLAAAWLIGERLYRSWWTTAVLVAALTLRHAIARSGTNTLEGYFHPRQLAFSLGALAIAALLRHRVAAAALLVLAGGLLHPTTAAWFTVWIAVAVYINESRWRRAILVGACGGVAGVVWVLVAGPLAGRLVIMDPAWLVSLNNKDYLFPLEWPVYAWLLNLAYAPLVLWIYRRRRDAGVITDAEPGVMWGCLSLVLVFAIALPMNAAHLAIVVQLQTPRVFWMLDFFATVYAAWAIAESRTWSLRRARLALAAIVVFSVTRSAYIKFVKFPDRPIAELAIPDNDWGQVMSWARRTPIDSGWIADPYHAYTYGTSLRVAGERDVLVEGVKDAAIGMYERDVAMRTRERLAEIQPFDQMTPERARGLAARHGLDYLVTIQLLDLPLAYSSGPLRVYRVR